MTDIVKLEQQLKAGRRTQERAYQNRKAKLRENYRYAREKGFCAADAQLLSFHTKGDIDKLAEFQGL